MPRPKNKEELLELSQKNYNKLLAFVSELPDVKKTNFPEGTLNRNVRDVLAHLFHWHQLILGWYEEGERRDKPNIPAKGYTWKTTPDLNKLINEKYQETSIKDAQAMLNRSHKEVIKLIKSLSNEELFTKKHFKWTGTTSLGAYFISATSSHYDWALKLIKKATK